MARPLILLTSGRYLLPAERGRMQEIVFGSPRAYFAALERAGAVPVVAPISDAGSTLAGALDVADGLLLTGGGDIAPEFLNAEPHPRIAAVDPGRDRTEFALIAGALERRLPILGVCKGIQTLNLAMGGGLIQHLDDTAPDAVGHWQRSPVPCGTHSIDIVAGTILAALAGGATTLRVNSYHHQALGAVADGLRVCARACDGVIEAVEADLPVPLLAVQFHPEETAPDDPFSQSLFDWLVQQAIARRDRQRAH